MFAVQETSFCMRRVFEILNAAQNLLIATERHFLNAVARNKKE
ncbi:hypothetical protein ANAEL_04661 [Anaerolineales bacterium]|nr:hypothetical protein ANAEL_04661 [Anaerolineales bacterium]